MSYSSNKKISDLEAKTTPIDADSTVIGDSADSNRAKQTTWANIKATLKAYFDTLYINGTGVANRIAYWVDTDTVGNLDTATYPSLTELSYVKGVTNAVQTQLNAKQATITTLGVANGGTGATTLAAHGVLLGNGISAVAVTGTGTATQVLTSNGASADPTFQDSTSTSYSFVPNTVETNNTNYTYQVPLIYDDASATNGFVGWQNANIGDATDFFGAGGYAKILSAGGSSYIYTWIGGTGSTDGYTASGGKSVSIKTRFRLSTTSNIKGFGLVNSAPTVYAAQSDTARGIRFVENAGTLYAQTADGTTATTTDVSSGITRTNWNTYSIVFNPAVNAKFYINGTLVATHTTNLPATLSLLFAFGIDTNTQYISASHPVISLQL